MIMKERLDILLVKGGYVPSREKAKQLIQSGGVSINGKKQVKAGTVYEMNSIQIEITGEKLRYVSRGGLKLEKAITEFSLDLNDKTCMDIGASTGGFTDCMLINGAQKVYSIDVGHGQLAQKLLDDSRVISLEKTNFRYITTEIISEKIDFASCDVSFISLSKIFEPAYNLLQDNGQMVCLIKPQFEAGREKVGKKGVVKNRAIHEKVVITVMEQAYLAGFKVLGLSFSPIRGPEGNIEYLLWIQKTTPELIMDYQKIAKEQVAVAHGVLKE